jgi:hypothetical protein
MGAWLFFFWAWCVPLFLCYGCTRLGIQTSSSVWVYDTFSFRYREPEPTTSTGNSLPRKISRVWSSVSFRPWDFIQRWLFNYTLSKSKVQMEFCASVTVKIMLIYCGFLFLRFLRERANGSTHVLSSLAARSQRFWKSRSSDRDFLRICKVETMLWQTVRTD